MSPEATELSGGGSDSTCRPPPSSGWEQDHSCGGGTLEREEQERGEGRGGWGQCHTLVSRLAMLAWGVIRRPH